MTMMTKTLDIMAKTLYGEARGEGIAGQIAVAHVINNRYLKNSWYGSSIQEVCLKDWQFSCWNEGDPNREKLVNLSKLYATYLRLVGICYYVIHKVIPDPTNGSTHYHTKAIHPKWVEHNKPVIEIGEHKFYNSIS